MSDSEESDGDGEFEFEAAGAPEFAGAGATVRYTGGDWLDGVPSRADLVAAACRAAGEKPVSPAAGRANANANANLPSRSPLFFMPVDVEDATEYVGAFGSDEPPEYVLRLYGALADGSKAEVTVAGIRPFFDAQVPDGVAPAAAEARVRQLAGACVGLEVVRAFPDRGYRREPAAFVRVSAPNLPARRAALEAVRGALVEPALGAAGARFETKSDDRSAYYRKAARELGLPLADWAVLADYEYTPGPTARSPLCAHVFRVAAAGYRPLADPLGAPAARAAAAAARAADPRLARDRTLVVAWDIETHSGRGTGDVPAPEHDADVVFMVCLTAHWKDDAAALARVCLVDVPAEPDPRWVTVVCGNQANILRAFALCLRALAPDVLAGFNDSGYDWPFVVGKLSALGALGWFVNTVSAAPRKAADEAGARRWNYRELQKIKISADETLFCSYLRVPGCVPIDVRACFKKLYPKSETPAAGSLKFYLAASGLPGKADMPIMRMWRAYEAATAALCAAQSAPLPAALPAAQSAPLPAALPAAQSAIAREMRRVAHYCVIDAERCQALLVRRAVLGDYREVSTLAFVALADSHYYAGGMKVCNLLGAYAWRRNVLVSMAAREREESGKYPGAYVFPPEKGIVPDPARLAAVDAAAAAGDGGALRAALAAFAPDRPVTGLDFSSLYPSLIMAYNLSPDRYLATETEAAAWRARGADIHPVEFPYGGATVRGWFVRHGNDPAEIGLYPSVLIDLFAKRAEVKVVLGAHNATREQVAVVRGRAAADRVGPAEALRRTRAAAATELAAADAVLARLDAGAPDSGAPTPESGSESPEAAAERSDATRRRKQAKGALAELDKILAAAAAAASAGAAGASEDANAANAASVDAAIAAAIADAGARADFEHVCADAKQKALKVYMNTFYGEAGNALSPFFLLPLAGGVTSAGKDNIQAVAEFVQQRGFGLKYGDTDSLYLTCPNRLFAECDAEYVSCLHPSGVNKDSNSKLAARERWWAAQVRVTMREMNLARDAVNAFLKARSGGPYLKMAYEEVLFPVVFTGKKKYFGIPHEHEVNFRPKDLFVRGIDVVKQGQPGLAREIGYRVMWACVALDNARGVRAIVEDALRDAVLNAAQWNFDHFVKTDAWKPLKNNIAVHRFINRMRARRAALEASAACGAAAPEAAAAATRELSLLTLPEPGERFSYIIARAGEAFDLRGRKAVPSKGDRMEFARAARELNIEVDVAYYMTQYVVGLCARFINGDFADAAKAAALAASVAAGALPAVGEAPASEAPAGEAPASEDQDAAATRADELAQRAAKAALEAFVRGLGGVDAATLRKRGVAYRRAYTAAAAEVRADLERRLGTAAAATLQSSQINYEMLVASSDVSAAVEALWASAGEFAAELAAARGGLSANCEAVARRLGVGAAGTPAASAAGTPAASAASTPAASAASSRSVSPSSVETAGGRNAPRPAQVSVFTLAALYAPPRPPMQVVGSALDRIEAAARAALAALVPAAAEVALRYEADLTRIVSQRRKFEHDLHPELAGTGASSAPAATRLESGAAASDAAASDAAASDAAASDAAASADAAPAVSPAGSPAGPPAGSPAVAAAVSVADKAILLRLRSAWFRAVGVQLSRARHSALGAHLQQLKAKRTGVTVAPGRAERAALVAAAAAAHRPLGDIAM